MKTVAVFAFLFLMQSAHAQARDARDCQAEGSQAYQEALEGDPSCQEDTSGRECREAAAAAKREAVRACISPQ